jgi:hypothetical protein
MNLDELFEGLDLDSPLTDHELDYLDILGKNPVDIAATRNLAEEEKSLDIFDTNDVELVNINDYEISGS